VPRLPEPLKGIERGCSIPGSSGTSRTSTVLAACSVLGLALLVRLGFFEGLWPADALHHVMYASQWNRLPKNHWETRLLYNGLLHLTIKSFGCGEPALALPSLIPSLGTCLLTMTTAAYIGTFRTAIFAGLIAATLPVDVVFATVPLPGCLATFFIAAGVACLLLDTVPGRNLLGPICFAFAMLAHLTSLFLVGSILVTAFLMAPNTVERRRAASWLVAAAVGFCTVEFLTFWWLTGDPLYEFRIIPKTSPRLDPGVTLFSPAWFIWPVLTWIVSKDFGLATLLVSILWVLWRRSTPTPIRLLLVGSCLFWIWIGYGSQSPFEFRPFWRSARFGQTFAAPLAVALGFYLARLGRAGSFLVGLLVATNLLLLAASGAWGQDVDINKELLPQIRSSSGIAFITDQATRDQLYVLNGCRYPSNVFTVDDPAIGLFKRYGTIVNPLGTNPMPSGFVETRTIAATARHYRAVSYLLPEAFRTRIGWFERRPAARLIEIDRVPG